MIKNILKIFCLFIIILNLWASGVFSFITIQYGFIEAIFGIIISIINTIGYSIWFNKLVKKKN